MSNQSGHKKTGLTELAALLTIGFSIYQGQKLGVIKPELIGHLVLTSWELASLAIPPALLAIRVAYKSLWRKDKRRASDVASDVVNADRELDK